MENNDHMINSTTIILVGSSKFDDTNSFKQLPGVKIDISNMTNLLQNKPYSLFSKSKLITLNDPTTIEFRNSITEYVSSRSAEKDYLIIYYSGHGITINNDFAFVFKNSTSLQTNKKVIPTSVVTYSEILNTLEIVKVIPIFIIDACESGIVFKKTNEKSINSMIIDGLRDETHSKFASDFALFCACGESESAHESSNGGYFSNSINNIVHKGIKARNKKPFLSISDIYNQILKHEITDYNEKQHPRIFYGHGTSDFPLAKNVLYSPTILKIENFYLNILEELWNNGNPIPLDTSEILNKIGKGAYANYSKLAYDAWSLIIKMKKVIKLSERGIAFMKNDLLIPDMIYKDETTDNKYIEYSEANHKTYYQFRPQKKLIK